MSIYIYTFDPKPKTVDEIEIYRLSFARANAEDALPVARIIGRARERWEGKRLPTTYIEGHWEHGNLVYQVTRTIPEPYWYDVDHKPGRPIVIGSLFKDGCKWKLHEGFSVERRECSRTPGLCKLREDDKREPVVGRSRLTYGDAVDAASTLNRAARISQEQAVYDVRPDSDLIR